MTDEWVDSSFGGEEDRARFFRLREEVIAAEDKAMLEQGIDPESVDMVEGKGGHWEWDGTGYEGPRYGIFSIWRPWETVHRDPLALLLSPEEGEEGLEYAVLPRTYKDRPGHVKEYYSENPLVRPPKEGTKHDWVYLSEQTPEEVLAIKFYDSEALKGGGDGKVRFMCPHSAFKLEGSEECPPRRSSELRVWCIW